MIYALLFLGVLIIFFPAMRCGLVVDDREWKNRVRQYREFFKKRQISAREWIRTLCYGCGLFTNPSADHAFTLFLHFINCCLVYRISGLFAAAILFMVNTVNNQTVLWLNGRRYQISLLAVLLAWNFKLLSPFLYCFALWIHVSALALPGLFLFFDWWLLPALIPFAFFFWYMWINKTARKLGDNNMNPGNEFQRITWRKAILYVKTFGFYFFHCLLPLKPRMYHEFLYYFGRYNKTTAEGYRINKDFALGAIALAFIMYEIMVRHNFFAWWFLIFISQWCNIYTVTQAAADRYTTIANVGLMVVLAQTIDRLPEPLNWITLTAFVVFYIVRYQPLFRAYRNVENYLLYHIDLEPAGVEARIQLSKDYINEDDIAGAFYTINQGLKHRPHDFRLLLQMITILIAMGQYVKAIELINLSRRHIPFGDEVAAETGFKNIFAYIAEQTRTANAGRPGHPA